MIFATWALWFWAQANVWQNFPSVVTLNWRPSASYHDIKPMCLGFVVSRQAVISHKECVKRIPNYFWDPLSSLSVSHDRQVLNVARSEVLGNLYVGFFVNPIEDENDNGLFPKPGYLAKVYDPLEVVGRDLVLLMMSSITKTFVINRDTPVDLWGKPCVLGPLMAFQFVKTASGAKALAGMVMCQPSFLRLSGLEIYENLRQLAVDVNVIDP